MSNDRKDRVFLSYASEDLPKTREVYEGLKKRELDVWFDKEDIKAGRWHPQIEEAIKQSRYFVICLSENAIKKIGHTHPGYQKEELSFAYEKAMEQPESEFTIVPTRIMRMEKSERGGYRLSPFQQYDLFDDFEKGLDKLAVDMGGISLSDATAKDERSEKEKLIDNLSARATTEYYAGRTKEPISILDTILVFSPDEKWAWFNKGVILRELGQSKEAIEAYDNALQIDPGMSKAWTNKGNILIHLDRHEEAMQASNKALEIDSDDKWAWFTKGVIFGDLGRSKEAIEAYDNALQIDPDMLRAWYNKGVRLYNLERHEEAVESLNKSLHINSDLLWAWYVKGLAHLHLDQEEEALDAFDKAVKLDPNYKDALKYREKLMKKLKENE